jgi:hypothetical protein
VRCALQMTSQLARLYGSSNVAGLAFVIATKFLPHFDLGDEMSWS